jgi:hypothetical protein
VDPQGARRVRKKKKIEKLADMVVKNEELQLVEGTHGVCVGCVGVRFLKKNNKKNKIATQIFLFFFFFLFFSFFSPPRHHFLPLLLLPCSGRWSRTADWQAQVWIRIIRHIRRDEEAAQDRRDGLPRRGQERHHDPVLRGPFRRHVLADH